MQHYLRCDPCVCLPVDEDGPECRGNYRYLLDETFQSLSQSSLKARQGADRGLSLVRTYLPVGPL